MITLAMVPVKLAALSVDYTGAFTALKGALLNNISPFYNGQVGFKVKLVFETLIM